MRSILILLLFLVAALVPVTAFAQYGEEIECRSRDHRYNECHAGFRGRAVLTRQTSDAACVEGRTWGQSQGGIWVDQGCSGWFADDYGGHGGYGQGHGQYDDGYGHGGGGGASINCKSRDYRQEFCAVDLRRARVYLERQESRAACVEGRSWGYDERGIWVSQGCDGYFRVEYR